MDMGGMAVGYWCLQGGYELAHLFPCQCQLTQVVLVGLDMGLYLTMCLLQWVKCQWVAQQGVCSPSLLL